MKAIAVKDTYLKDLPADHSQCGERARVEAGTEYEIINRANAKSLNSSYLLLANPVEGSRRWWVYAPDWKVEGTEDGNNPTESIVTEPLTEPPELKPDPIKFFVPGISQELTENSPIYANGRKLDFTWGEAIVGPDDGSIRMPVDIATTQRIIQGAEFMQEIRAFLGDRPIKVNSWYRDPDTNWRIGGASQSEHMKGWAIDFYVIGEDVVDTFYKLKSFCTGGLAVGCGFVHADLGESGRWTYPGGPSVALWG